MSTEAGILAGDGSWPFVARIVGDDVICDNVMATCFGGWGTGREEDDLDDGRTASGRNTKTEEVWGVSLPMDSRFWPRMDQTDPGGYKALYGAPFPRFPWGTQVEVTIGGVSHIPRDGIVDLGPGKRATRRDDQLAHALDLTVLAAALWSKLPLVELANSFEARTRIRIIGGAKYCLTAPKALLG